MPDYLTENALSRQKLLSVPYRSSYKKVLVSVTAGLLIVGLLQAVTGSTSGSKEGKEKETQPVLVTERG